MAMAAIDPVSVGGPGGWKTPLLGLARTSRGGLGFVHMGRRGVEEEGLYSSAGLGGGRFMISSLDGERVKLVVSSAGGEGACTAHCSSRERGTRRNSEMEEKCGHHGFENSQDGSILSTDCGASEEGSLTSSSLEESTSRSGRRTFSTSCLFALAALPFVGRTGEAQAEGAPVRPEKKKARAPSSPYDEDRLLEQNRRMQRMNNAPTEFPGFVREGFQVKVIASEKYVTSKSGLIYYDMVVGNGDLPKDGQQFYRMGGRSAFVDGDINTDTQVIFHYTGYNESGRRVDSSYQQGRPARTRVGIQGMIPGFEEGIKSMRPGGRRIIIVPPELGPPVGPSTFFSAKQFEVFDVELLEAKDCSRRTLLFYSDVVCD